MSSSQSEACHGLRAPYLTVARELGGPGEGLGLLHALPRAPFLALPARSLPCATS